MLDLCINVNPDVLLVQVASSEEAPFTPLSYRKLSPVHVLQKD